MARLLIERYLKEGKLRVQKAGIVQIEALLREAATDLNEAKKISGLAQRATYLLAYIAMLKAGRALLLLNGYRPADGAQHKTVVEVTEAFLGKEFEKLTMQFETMRRKRNAMTYEAGALLSKKEAQKALEDAIALVQKISNIVKAKDPQFKLKF